MTSKLPYMVNFFCAHTNYARTGEWKLA